MNLKFILYLMLGLMLIPGFTSANDAWQLTRTYESQQFLDSPFFLISTADINRNGLKEIIFTDFGKFGNHIEEWKLWKKNIFIDNIKIVEFENKNLKVTFHKQWNSSKMKSDLEANRYFMAYKSAQLVPFTAENKIMVETIPPFLGIEWKNEAYELHEQQGWVQQEPLVGSWFSPWVSPSCYQGFPNKMTWPRECIVAVRNFGGKSKIVTLLEKEINNNKQYKQTLRVRKIDAGFPIEWEKEISNRFVIMEPIDIFSQKASAMLLLRVYKTAKWYSLEESWRKGAYNLKELSLDGSKGMDLYDLPDIYIGSTRNKKIQEFWGYRRVSSHDSKSLNFILQLRRVSLNADSSDFIKEDIDFPHHGSFLGVGYFDIADIDNDGLDEIILVEETAGKISFAEEQVRYDDIKDYIHILKWDGSTYKNIWVSQAYTKRGTKFLVEDIKNTGNKQLIVFSPYGTVQIWERQ